LGGYIYRYTPVATPLSIAGVVDFAWYQAHSLQATLRLPLRSTIDGRVAGSGNPSLAPDIDGGSSPTTSPILIVVCELRVRVTHGTRTIPLGQPRTVWPDSHCHVVKRYRVAVYSRSKCTSARHLFLIVSWSLTSQLT